ncbi:MAG: hypothetical protein B9S32_15630 [Verrucomicrobia bacterium Tous-C9LFEB]|nr:MAG: hypothetical protein B9S32_15630 [Verrucomicrobia bacterium Tous-C9LFEB]
MEIQKPSEPILRQAQEVAIRRTEAGEAEGFVAALLKYCPIPSSLAPRLRPLPLSAPLRKEREQA